jgi:hypothetical protein
VRLSVDVPPADHAALVELSISIARSIGATRVHHREIMWSLLRLALEDPDIAGRAAELIEEQRRRAH